jgi:hypothetical protein
MCVSLRMVNSELLLDPIGRVAGRLDDRAFVTLGIRQVPLVYELLSGIVTESEVPTVEVDAKCLQESTGRAVAQDNAERDAVRLRPSVGIPTSGLGSKVQRFEELSFFR